MKLDGLTAISWENNSLSICIPSIGNAKRKMEKVTVFAMLGTHGYHVYMQRNQSYSSVTLACSYFQ